MAQWVVCKFGLSNARIAILHGYNPSTNQDLRQGCLKFLTECIRCHRDCAHNVHGHPVDCIASWVGTAGIHCWQQLAQEIQNGLILLSCCERLGHPASNARMHKAARMTKCSRWRKPMNYILPGMQYCSSNPAQDSMQGTHSHQADCQS